MILLINGMRKSGKTLNSTHSRLVALLIHLAWCRDVPAKGMSSVLSYT